ncbi:MAG: A/G-specific adenine glycosylase [Firmicutes bacterium]|nr:A/G-specific adenine glycosylase [Bacillota bacterium]
MALIPRLRRALLSWYDAHRRELPWRARRDPYAVLVSEFMLQQTRVETVLRYYDGFLAAFPDLHALAAASEDDVLRAWQGLGYYGRARRLRALAQVVRERWGGELPEDAARLRELPGVGPYLAGAVASIAFGRREAAVDGNVRRVLGRLFDLDTPSPARLERLAARLLDPRRPGDWNQALMELGATVCRPRAPRCAACPLAAWCRAHRRGRVKQRPAARRRAAPAEVERATLVRVRDGRVALERRPPGGLLGGLYGFPGEDLPAGAGEAAARRALSDAWGAPPAALAAWPPYRHVFTHRAWTVRPFLWAEAGGAEAGTGAGRTQRKRAAGAGASEAGASEAGLLWLGRAELAAAPLPRAFEPLRRVLLEGSRDILLM